MYVYVVPFDANSVQQTRIHHPSSLWHWLADMSNSNVNLHNQNIIIDIQSEIRNAYVRLQLHKYTLKYRKVVLRLENRAYTNIVITIQMVIILVFA
jgi:hypothetical protein